MPPKKQQAKKQPPKKQPVKPVPRPTGAGPSSAGAGRSYGGGVSRGGCEVCSKKFSYLPICIVKYHLRQQIIHRPCFGVWRMI